MDDRSIDRVDASIEAMAAHPAGAGLRDGGTRGRADVGRSGTAADDAERRRLEGAVAAARKRAAAARFRAQSREDAARAALHAELVAVRRALADAERRHELEVASIRAAAADEVRRILDKNAVCGDDPGPSDHDAD